MTVYPPLTPLSVMPLHGGRADFDDGWSDNDPWYACGSPDRQADSATLFDWRCSECVRLAKVCLETLGDSTEEWRPHLGAEPEIVMLSWLVARADYWNTPIE